MPININYFEDVLGVREILIPEGLFRLPSEAQQETEKTSLLFLSLKVLTPAEQNLFDKIAAATKLPQQQIQHQVLNFEQLDTDNLSAQQIIFLGAPPHALIEQLERNLAGSLTQISSLEEMINVPALKKKAWESLQIVLKQIH